ncbi:MAG: MFS transporter [Saprospiraceae bacterium]
MQTIPNNARLRLSRIGVALIFAISGFLHANWVGRLPRLQEMYDLNHAQLGLVLLAGSIGSLVAMPITGRIIILAGSHRITRFSLLVFCLMTPLVPLFPSVWLLGFVLFLLGGITGSMDVAMNAQALLVERGLSKPVMASFHAIFSAGMMLGAGCSALFNRLEVSLVWHLFIVTLPALLAALWAISQLIPEERTEQPVLVKGERNVLAHPPLVMLGLIAFCCMLGEGAMADWTTNYLEKVSGGGRYWSPFGLVAFAMAMMTGRFLGDKARQRFGDPQLLKVGGWVAAFGMALSLLIPHVAVGITGFFMVGLGLSTIVPVVYSTAGNMPGLPSGVGISMVTTIGYAGFLIGPPLIGFISEWLGLRTGMGTVLALFLVMIALNGLNSRRVAPLKDSAL